jgi:heat shock protein beta
MFKKMEKADYEKFWKEYSTNIKLGVIEDPSNRTRLAKLLMFNSSNQSGMTDLVDYVSRMKDKQEYIYYIAGANRKEVSSSKSYSCVGMSPTWTKLLSYEACLKVRHISTL